MPDEAASPERHGTTDRTRAFREAGALRALPSTQSLDRLEALGLDDRVSQLPLSEIEERTGLRFPDVLWATDSLVVPEARAERGPLGSVEDIRW
jgi:endonuclease G